ALAHVQATLDWVERSNVLIIPLDERQGWYRFHPLFQRLLQQRLQARISREELARLHRRASAWYASQGLIQEAIEHALVAGDASGAARLVGGRFLWGCGWEQWGGVECGVRLVPAGQTQSRP